MVYKECKATLFNDASSKNNTPKHEAPLCARDCGIDSNYFIMAMGPEGWGGGGGGGGGVRTPRTPSLDPPLSSQRSPYSTSLLGGGGAGPSTYVGPYKKILAPPPVYQYWVFSLGRRKIYSCMSLRCHNDYRNV